MSSQQLPAWHETKWAECGDPLMRLKWIQIPIHARQEACVIQDGRPCREQYSLRPRTHGSQWKAIDQQGMREKQWDEPKQENRKQQKVTAGQCRVDQRTEEWLQLRSHGGHRKNKDESTGKHTDTARWDSPHASWMNILRESCPDLHNLNELIDRIGNSAPLQELQPPQTSYCWTATAICWAAVVLI